MTDECIDSATEDLAYHRKLREEIDEASACARKYYQKYRKCANTRKELRELKDDAIRWAQRRETERDDLRAKLDGVTVFLKWMMAQDEIFDVDKYITDVLKRLEG